MSSLPQDTDTPSGSKASEAADPWDAFRQPTLPHSSRLLNPQNRQRRQLDRPHPLYLQPRRIR